MRRAELQARWTAKPSDDDRTTMSDPTPTTITELLTRARAHLDDYSQFLRRLPDDHQGRAKIGPLALTSALCVEVLADLREHTPEPSATVRVEDEADVPPLTYTLLLGGQAQLGLPQDCYQVPGRGETIGLRQSRYIVTGVHWLSSIEAEVSCVVAPGYERGGVGIDADL
jgi:hypothetical protein